MIKINKRNLKLDKEIISTLSENELSNAKGGFNKTNYTCLCYEALSNSCPPAYTVGGDCFRPNTVIKSCNCQMSIDICRVTENNC